MNTVSNPESQPVPTGNSHPALPEPGPLPPLPPEAPNPAALAPILPPVSSSQAAALMEARPLPPPAQPRTLRRNGRVARLPKLERDMVCRMLSNGVPYKQIVAALDEVGFTLSERNISNWATGGYLDWRLQQEQVLQSRLAQDDLLDFLRRQDASELPEVGLQAAATRLSQILLQKAVQGDDLESNPGAFAGLVNLLCRLTRELFRLQKYRDDSARSLGRDQDPARIRHENEEFTAENELFYSQPPDVAPATTDQPGSGATDGVPPTQPASPAAAPAVSPSTVSLPAVGPVPVSAAPGREALPLRPGSVLTPDRRDAQSGQRPEPLPPAGSSSVGPGRSW